MPLNDVAELVWDNKYRLRDSSGRALEGSFSETCDRVADTLAATSVGRQQANAIADAMRSLQLLPGGRILANAHPDGAPYNRTLVNTFVVPTPMPDAAARLAALEIGELAMASGAGIGVNFDRLGRTSDADLLDELERWNEMCRQTVARYGRGAMMAVLDAEHPAASAFIKAKLMPGRLTHFNLSVWLRDHFLLGSDAHDTETSVNATLGSGAQIVALIASASHAASEPGVIFGDTINRLNPLRYREAITATNSCAESPLPAWGSAPIASINLSALVRNPSRPLHACGGPASSADGAPLPSSWLRVVAFLNRG